MRPEERDVALLAGVSLAFRQEHQEIPWRSIAGFRDVLAHDYMDLDYELVYTAARDRVPPLLAALEAILEVKEARGSYRVRRRRISVDLNGRLLARARVKAFSQGLTVSELAEQGLQQLLALPGSRQR